MKKVPFADKNGDYNLKYNMQNLTEDFYLPVRGGDSGTQIDNLSGLEYSSIDDIDYLKNKLFASTFAPVPKYKKITKINKPLYEFPAQRLAQPIEFYPNSFSSWKKSLNYVL